MCIDICLYTCVYRYICTHVTMHLETPYSWNGSVCGAWSTLVGDAFFVKAFRFGNISPTVIRGSHGP